MEHWEELIFQAVRDPVVRPIIQGGLEFGYGNIGLPAPRDYVAEIFNRLGKADPDQIASCLEEIRASLSQNIRGRSTGDWWADYYRSTEAPFIVNQFKHDVAGPNVLEVGTGKGLISSTLLQKRPDLQSVTQTDIADYRIADSKNDARVAFIRVTQDEPLPFDERSFDSVIVIYVLHHHPDGEPWKRFVQKLGRVARKRLIILEDSLFDNQASPSQSISQAPLWEELAELTPLQKKLVLAFQCTFGNKVDGGGSDVPAPCTFKSHNKLMEQFTAIFPKATVKNCFLGISKTKVYLNPESLFVIEFD